MDLPEYNDDAESDDSVIVPETPNPLDERTFASFLDRISVVEREDPWDTAPYRYALQTLDSLLAN